MFYCVTCLPARKAVSAELKLLLWTFYSFCVISGEQDPLYSCGFLEIRKLGLSQNVPQLLDVSVFFSPVEGSSIAFGSVGNGQPRWLLHSRLPLCKPDRDSGPVNQLYLGAL